MKRRFVALFLAAGLLATGLTGCAGKSSEEKQGGTAAGIKGEITIAGSTSMQPLSELLADGFMKANKEVKVTVQGGGSGVGIEQVTAGTINIGSSSRELKPEEQGKGLNEYVICKDGIAVVVNPANKIADLSKEQLKNIFAGKISNWKEVGGDDAAIVVINRESGSGTRGAFEELVMGKDTPLVKSIEQNSTGAVRTAVAADKNAIGYVSITGLGSGVKAITVDKVACTPENIKNGTYAISRPFLYLTKGEPNEVVKAYLDFVKSDEGKKIITEEGLILP